VFPRYQRVASALYELLGVVSLEEVVAAVADLVVRRQEEAEQQQEAV
jgi:hypothetical protein